MHKIEIKKNLVQSLDYGVDVCVIFQLKNVL